MVSKKCIGEYLGRRKPILSEDGLCDSECDTYGSSPIALAEPDICSK